jgi:hypothetical protein
VTDVDAVRLLRQLRRHPEIFGELEVASGTELQRQRQLRERHPDDLVRAALSLDELRRRAAAKFTRADQMWFDRQGLEQATAEAVARHKAGRFDGPVWDVCCGVGGDAVALAEHGSVVAVDRSPLACLWTEWNAEVYGVSDRVEVRCADWPDVYEEARGSGALLHVDPDRRTGPRRSLRVEDAEPGLDSLRQMERDFDGGAFKLSPAANFPGKFPDAEIELVSLHGECKEATVWFGRLGTPGLWRATVLPDGATLAADPLDALPDVGPLGEFLCDPDPAVVRAGLVSHLAETLGLRRLDDADEYLTADEPVSSPFLRTYRVLAELPNNDRAVRGHFRQSGYGQVEIKCRHVPVQAEAVRRKLPLADGPLVSLVYAKIQGKTRVVVATRMTNGK